MIAIASLAGIVGACGESAPRATSVPAMPAPSQSGSEAAVALPRPPSTAASALGNVPDDASVPNEDAATPFAVEAAPHEPVCQPQDPQAFLIRSTFIPKWNAALEEKKRAAAAHQEAIRYRTEQYGFHPGFGRREWNAHEPPFYVVDTTFMGLAIKMHKRVVPALKCVEEAIKTSCAAHPYTPRALAGIRYKNTYAGGEITNHIFGIAIDVDPSLNTCCGCVKPWSEDARCQRPSKSIYDRMTMPECWVQTFEKYGFYWLGHDVLKDTMHFEFLGDPEKIMK
jgi:hypothetical protein